MSQLLEEILSRENMLLAYKRVKANKGARGIDGITIEEIDGYLRENWVDIREKIRKRKYQPQPVRRVEIPKPNGGGKKSRNTNGNRPYHRTSDSTETDTDSRTAFQRIQLWVQTETESTTSGDKSDKRMDKLLPYRKYERLSRRVLTMDETQGKSSDN